MNLDFQGFVQRNLIPQAPPLPGEDLPERPLWQGWFVFGATLFFGFLLAFSGNGPWALIYFSVATLHLLVGLNTVKEPEEAIFFSLGRALFKLKRGWWLTLGPIHNVEIETTARQILHAENSKKEEQNLYYIDEKRKIAIAVKMRVFLRLVNLKGALLTYGGLNTEASRSDIEATSYAALRGALGRKDFAGLLEDKGEVEKDIELATNAELNDLWAPGPKREPAPEADPQFLNKNEENRKLARSGYIIESVDIYDYDERVQSEASRIKELAEAKAFEAGETAKAVADPLRGNMPAAIAQSVSTVATTLRDINRDRTEARREERKGPKDTAPNEETASLLGKLQELLTERK